MLKHHSAGSERHYLMAPLCSHCILRVGTSQQGFCERLRKINSQVYDAQLTNHCSYGTVWVYSLGSP